MDKLGIFAKAKAIDEARDAEKSNAQIQKELADLKDRVKSVCKNLHDSKKKKPKKNAGSTSGDLKTLVGLIEQTKLARLEAFEYSKHGRQQLVDEVKRLQDILEDARDYAVAKELEVENLRSEVERLQRENCSLHAKIDRERQAFSGLLQDERVRYGDKLRAYYKSSCISEEQGGGRDE